MSPKEYFEGYYEKERSSLSAGVLCGATLSEFFADKDQVLSRVHVGELLLCEYELNVLAQIIHAHFREDFDLWSSVSAPRTDCRCASSHGGAGHPISILKIAERESARFNHPVVFTLDQIRMYDTFFLAYAEDLISQNSFKRLTTERLIEAVKNDPDCSNVSLRNFFSEKRRSV